MDNTQTSKILLVRLSALGDVIQTLPVLAALRQGFPQAFIGWLVEEDAAALIEGHPMLDAVHISKRKRWVKSLIRPWQWFATFKEVRAFYREIHEARYDVALDFQGLLKSAFTMYFTGIQRRVGFASARELAPWLYTEKVTLPGSFFDPAVPILRHFMALACSLGELPEPDNCPLPVVSDATVVSVRALLGDTLSKRPVVVLAPATQWQSKHWPSSYWSQLIQEILDKTGMMLLMVGGKKDSALIETILSGVTSPVKESRVINLAGKTSIQQLQQVFEWVDAIIGLDSAPLHLAGAVGKAKLVGLFGPTAYRRTPPPGQQHTILSTEAELSCQPCDQTLCPLGTDDCMKRLTPDMVFSTLTEVLANNSIRS